jgi:hypothetical protein
MNIFEIRNLLSRGQFEFSRHALKRAVERNISDREIQDTGESFELLEDYPGDKYSPSCLGLGFTRNNRPLHLQVCYSNENMLKIIILYEPNAEEWTEYRTRRPMS